MKGRQIAGMVGMVVGCGLLIAWAAKRQPLTLQPCPFDANLSLGVAFQGPHLHFDTYAVQDKLMHARIAWFSPTEHPDPDVFEYRVAQEPPEDDWDWWTTLYPTTLLVQVTDAQNRLGKAEVWKLEGNILKGIFPASSDGSTIIGSLGLEAPTSFWRLSIKDKRGGTLAEALIRNPKTKLTAVVLYARWVPHPPKRDVVVELSGQEPHYFSPQPGMHAVTRYDFENRRTVTEYHKCTVSHWRLKGGCPPHDFTIFNSQHNVEDVGVFGPPPEGCSILDIRGAARCRTWVDVVVEGPLPSGIELCMTKHFVNDTPNPDFINPPQRYQKRHVLRIIPEFPPSPYILEDDRPKIAELERLQTSEDPTSVTPSVQVPPYSKGCLHWDFLASTDIRAVYFAPVRKVERHKDVFDYILEALPIAVSGIMEALPIAVSGIMGSAHPKANKIVEALTLAWTKDVSQRREVKEAFQVGDLKFYGDIWVLHLSLAQSGPMYPLQNITQPVTVRVVLVDPEGNRTPTDADVECEPITPLTTPPPPQEAPIFARVSAKGTQVHLGKGWKWLIKVTHPGEGSVTISVPPTSSVTVEARIP